MNNEVSCFDYLKKFQKCNHLMSNFLVKPKRRIENNINICPSTYLNEVTCIDRTVSHKPFYEIS